MGDKKSKRITVEVCTGSHCAEQKSKKTAKRMKAWIEEHNAEDKISVKKCDCLKQCKKAAVVLVPRKDLVFEKVKPDDADRILKSILD